MISFHYIWNGKNVTSLIIQKIALTSSMFLSRELESSIAWKWKRHFYPWGSKSNTLLCNCAWRQMLSKGRGNMLIWCNSLPFRPMIKFTFGPNGTSSIVWHMKFTRVIFSIIPTSASDCNKTRKILHGLKCLNMYMLYIKNKREPTIWNGIFVWDTNTSQTEYPFLPLLVLHFR